MPRLRLNEKTIKTRKYPIGKQVIVWDATLPAFGARTSIKTGKLTTYIVQGRVNGRSARKNVGRTDVISLADAKAKAKRMLVDLGDGVDPRAKKRDGGKTLRSTLDDYIGANVKLKERSVESYRDNITRHLGDWLDAPIASITRDMVERRHRQIAADVEAHDRAENAKRAREHLIRAERAEQHWPEAAERHRAKWQAAREREPRSGHGAANGTMRGLRALLNFEIDKEHPIIEANPVRLKKRWFDVEPREGEVRPEDMEKFFDAVMSLENPIARDYVILVLFTGLRRREATSLTWGEVDLKSRIIRIPASRTKNRKRLDLPMSDVAHDMLAARRAIGDTHFVFPSDGSASGHIEENEFADWKIVRGDN